MPEDFEYFSRRADQELAAAANAGSPIAASVHREMAERFRLRAEELKAATFLSLASNPNKAA